MEELYKLLEESLNERLYQLSVGGPRNKDGDIRLKQKFIFSWRAFGEIRYSMKT